MYILEYIKYGINIFVNLYVIKKTCPTCLASFYIEMNNLIMKL